MRAKIMGVELPFDLEDFCTPHWPAVLKHFPEWKAEVKWNGEEPWPIQPYMMEFAKSLEKSGYQELLGTRIYKTADDILERYFAHFGLANFADEVEKSRIENSAHVEALLAHALRAEMHPGKKRPPFLTRSVLTNIRMEVQDAKSHYSKAMHTKMLGAVDWLLACIENPQPTKNEK